MRVTIRSKRRGIAYVDDARLVTDDHTGNEWLKDARGTTLARYTPCMGWTDLDGVTEVEIDWGEP